jgi:hypothetical protein
VGRAGRRATGELPLVELPPLPGMGGPGQPGPPPRRGTGEQRPVGPPRRPAGERSRRTPAELPLEWGTGEQPLRPPPPRHATGELPVVGRPSRRAELRRQAGRAPVLALAVAALVLLAVLPVALVLRDASADPVFAGLDSLQLPTWAAQAHQDSSTGSKWCVDTCRLRERTWRSAKPAKDTDQVYRLALADAGWRPRTGRSCPTSVTGSYSCWEHDRYVLDLWSRDAACDLADVAPAPGASAPAADPSAAIPAPNGTDQPATCGGALVTAKATEQGDPNFRP